MAVDAIDAPVRAPERLDASEASRAMARGDLSAGALTAGCLARWRARDGDVRAWTFLDPDLAMNEARKRDGEARRGPMHGIPVGVKDVIFTADMPTSYNSPHFADHFPRWDAACIDLLRQAGAIILGKCDTVEFAVNGRRARTHNPHDLARTPGGSSSGSAAAVADFQTPLALGTQTGGSVIRPASYCGVFAMKPTWGTVSLEGFKTCAPSLDTLGWFARSAEDLGLLCDAFGIETDERPAVPSLRGARVAICRTPVWDQALPETRAAIDGAANVLRSAGAEVTDLDLPEPFSQLTRAHKIIMQGEMRSAFLPEHRRIGAALYPELDGILRNVDAIPRAEQKSAYDLAAECRRRFDELAHPFAAVITPSAPGEAPIGLETTGAATFNRIWTLLHAPCINIPGFTGPGGLPVGFTVTGPRFADRGVLAVAQLLAEQMPAQNAPAP